MILVELGKSPSFYTFFFFFLIPGQTVIFDNIFAM